MMLPGPAGFWPFPSEQGVCSAACSRWLAGHLGVHPPVLRPCPGAQPPLHAWRPLQLPVPGRFGC